MIKPFERMLRRSLDVVFPRDCGHCGEIVPEGGSWDYLCEDCGDRLDWIRGPVCETCGHPYPGIGSNQPCEHCEALDPVFSSGRCCVLHREVGASLVRGLKYHRGLYFATDMAAMVADSAEIVEHVRGAILVPVPLHPKRERERGFNQSAVFAHALAKVLPVEGVESLLERGRSTVTQTRLPRAERLKNVRGAFSLSSVAAVRADLTYVVVDDVFTTGSTMNECCRILRKAGAKSLKVLAFAHG